MDREPLVNEPRCWRVAVVAVLACHGFAGTATWATEADDEVVVDPSSPRLYASGGLASSVFSAGASGGLPGPVSGFGFGGGEGAGAEGAIGMAVARPAGSLRMEVEARGRQADASPGTSMTDGSSRQTWATMANVWRDVAFSKRFGGYAGGGVGGGGLTETASGTPAVDSLAARQASGLAWQAGGGLTYAVSERVTLDLGYRYRALEATGGLARDAGSEAILAVRIYEPFRDLWK
jgi:opacity protein-like surface antigen